MGFLCWVFKTTSYRGFYTCLKWRGGRHIDFLYIRPFFLQFYRLLLKQHSYKNATNRYKSLYRGLSPYQDWFISKMLTKFETKSARVKGWFMFFYLSFSWASFWLSFVNIFKLFHLERVTACVCVLFNICFLCIIGLNRTTVSQIFLTRPNSLLAKCSGNDHL